MINLLEKSYSPNQLYKIVKIVALIALLTPKIIGLGCLEQRMDPREERINQRITALDDSARAEEQRWQDFFDAQRLK